MLLTSCACINRGGINARGYALCYFCLPLEQRLCEKKSVTHTTLLKPGHPRTVRTLANEDAVIAAMKQESWRNPCDIARELDLF
jgi:hypothetical protein